jgi:hypothetical protein
MKQFDVRSYPPPDLAIDVEITRRQVDRTPIYQALGVRELWRYDGKHLRISLLRHGRYIDIGESQVFPDMPLVIIARLLALVPNSEEGAWAREVRGWVRSSCASLKKQPGRATRLRGPAREGGL